MNTHSDKSQNDQKKLVEHKPSAIIYSNDSAFQLADNRPDSIALKCLQEMANNNPRAIQFKTIQAMSDNSPQSTSAAKLQVIANHTPPTIIQKQENKTGLPDKLKTGVENLSGMSLDDVKVHRNSDKPVQLHAHAYAQGTDIHLAPGQEKHLPHETWHVIQQKQGRVNPTTQVKGDVYINDDQGLEKEADVMGEKAFSTGAQETTGTQGITNTGSAMQLLPLHKSVYPLIPENNDLSFPSPPFATQFQSIIQRETTPSVTEGVGMDIMGNLSSISTSYAIAIIKKELVSHGALQSVMVHVLNYAFDSILALSNWISVIKDVALKIKAIGDIPRGVVAVFLWGMGKLFMWFANKYYNGGWLSYGLGDITEAKVYKELHKIDDIHKAIHYFVVYLEGVYQKITWFINSGNSQSDNETSEQETLPESVQDNSSNFLSLNVEAPTLKSWTDEKKRERAGLDAKASAHVKLLGQTMGGDFDVKLPFGTGWQIGIDNFFKSSAFSFAGFSVGNVRGDTLQFTNEGLMLAQMSVNNLNVAKDIVTAEKIEITYRRNDNSLAFLGKGSAKLWGDKRLDGDIQLHMGLDGTFKEAHIRFETDSKFNAIPNHLDFIGPGGQVEIYSGKAPNIFIHSGISLYGLPNDIKAKATGGVKYKNNVLTGFLQNLDVNIPLGKGANLFIAVIEADFSKDGLEAKKAYMDFDYDKSKANDGTQGVSTGDIFKCGVNLAWLDIDGLVNVEQISAHVGMKSLSLSGGKFDYEMDDTTGLRKLQARVLGVSAKYDAEAGTGSLEGHVNKEVETPALSIDFPALPGVGGSLSLSGMFGFGVGLSARFETDNTHSTKELPVLILSGDANASAYAALKLAIGAFIGLPYLAKIQGNVYGQITGSIKGSVELGGHVIIQSKAKRMISDPKSPVKGHFELEGNLSAQVGAELKAKVLVFEKQLGKAELGDWILGKYILAGDITSNENGLPEFTNIQRGFEDGKPKPVKVIAKNIPVDEWILEHKKENTQINYDSHAKKQVSKVARNLIYGGFCLTDLSKLKIDYMLLLKNTEDKINFSEAFIHLYHEEAGDGKKVSFVWSNEIWAKSVNMHKIMGIDQSKSKRKVYNLLIKYHLHKQDEYDYRIRTLMDIETIILNYANKRSKIPENIQETLQLLNQVNLEIAMLVQEKSAILNANDSH